MSLTITRANVEAELIDRVGPALAMIGRDGTTKDGTNPDLNGPIRIGLGSLGITPASFGTVANSDLSVITADQVNQLFDVSELRALRNIATGFTKVDFQVDRDLQKRDQFRQGIKDRIAELQAHCERSYGFGLQAPTVGIINFGFDTEPTTEPDFG